MNYYGVILGPWSLVPYSSSMNVLGCKWVFRIKRNASGGIEHYKARLIAKGFHQLEWHDYYKRFSHGVKPTTIHIMLYLAVTHKWSLRQLDVKNAFLHGELQEQVFMSQPLGFVHPLYPNVSSQEVFIWAQRSPSILVHETSSIFSFYRIQSL